MKLDDLEWKALGCCGSHLFSRVGEFVLTKEKEVCRVVQVRDDLMIKDYGLLSLTEVEQLINA
jgi:hypothetical protein